MLDTYESYSTVWAAQLRKSQKFRDSMDGIVNRNQALRDKPVNMRVEEDFINKEEMKKVLSQAFIGEHGPTQLDEWVCQLR